MRPPRRAPSLGALHHSSPDEFPHSVGVSTVSRVTRARFRRPLRPQPPGAPNQRRASTGPDSAPDPDRTPRRRSPFEAPTSLSPSLAKFTLVSAALPSARHSPWPPHVRGADTDTLTSGNPPPSPYNRSEPRTSALRRRGAKNPLPARISAPS